MVQKVIKTGHSAAVTIPSDFVRSMGIKIGDSVAIETRPETGKIIYKFKGARQLLLTRDILKKSRR